MTKHYDAGTIIMPNKILTQTGPVLEHVATLPDSGKPWTLTKTAIGMVFCNEEYAPLLLVNDQLVTLKIPSAMPEEIKLHCQICQGTGKRWNEAHAGDLEPSGWVKCPKCRGAGVING